MTLKSMSRNLTVVFVFICSTALLAAEELRVSDIQALRKALTQAKPGTSIVIEKGEYSGGFFAGNLHGTAAEPILIKASDLANRPIFRMGKNGIHFSKVSHLVIDGLVIDKVSGNGLNIDDGGGAAGESHHITLRNVDVTEAGTAGGNLDGIKISGIDDFKLERCRVLGWGSGGSAVDMVGCHNGVIQECYFRADASTQGTGLQTKGGSADIVIQGCRFEQAGSRAVNIGGSTGPAFFRPRDANYEAKRITVEDCVFIGSHAPVVFVGVDGATVRHNTIYDPGKYVMRILQETREKRFVACRGGVFEKNLVVYDPAKVLLSTNVGQGTDPDSFQLRGNAWVSQTGRGSLRHEMPTQDDVVIGKVVFVDESNRDFRLKGSESGKAVGSRNEWALKTSH